MEEALKDARFSHILTDPRFRKMPRNVRKVAIDKRFKGMFKDKKFKGKCVLDKRGRPLDLTSTENLKKLYEVSSESSESGNDDNDISNESEENKCDDNNLQTTSNDGVTNELREQLSKSKKKLVSQSTQLSKNVSKINIRKNRDIESSEEKDVEAVTPNKIKSTSKNKNDKKNLSKIQNELSVDALTGKGYKELNVDKSFDTANLNIKQIETRSPGKNKTYLKDNINKAIKQTEVSSSDDEENLDDQVDDVAEEKDSSDESDESEESDSDDSDEEEDVEFDHHWEELRNEAPETDEITHRFAVCNMDWDRIRAEDLFVCFESFKPTHGCINSVKIYPSEYGLKRMEEEKLNGPPELVQETLPLDAEEEEDKKGSKYHREKLRQYQINRLKYYYAVVDCDSSETANLLYQQLNGMEYESSSVTFDLRFIPDDLTFDDQEPTSIADKLFNPHEYKPRLFVTTALQQVKVNLTWDETDPNRRETLQKAFTQPADIEKDINDYLASSSGESEEEQNPAEDANLKLSTKDRIAKYKELLLSLEEKEKDENKYEMEITWEPGLKEKTEEVVKEKLKKDQLNPFEKKLQKKKEERKLKKKQQKVLQNQSDDGRDSAYSDEEFFSKPTSNTTDEDSKRLAELALISDSKKNLEIDEKPNKKSKKYRLQKKKEKLQKDNFQMDVNDPRFSAIYSSHLFNIDPSDPHYKDTEGNRALIQKKQEKLKSDGFGSRNKNVKKARYS